MKKDWDGFLGKINFGEDGLSYQKKIKNEWNNSFLIKVKGKFQLKY